MTIGDEDGRRLLSASCLHVSTESTCLVEDAQKACGPARTDGTQGQEGSPGPGAGALRQPKDPIHQACSRLRPPGPRPPGC